MKIHLVSKANITYLKEKQHLHRHTFGFIALCDNGLDVNREHGDDLRVPVA
jgi:hypothetical protein